MIPISFQCVEHRLLLYQAGQLSQAVLPAESAQNLGDCPSDRYQCHLLQAEPGILSSE